jgi:hypothetical protein
MSTNRWIAAAAVVASLIIGVLSYNAGVAQGMAHAAAAAGAAPFPPYAYAWGWYRPWGFGFPWLFLLFAFLLLRGCFWGGPWRRRWYYYGDHVPPSFDEWHKRAHEQMKEK